MELKTLTTKEQIQVLKRAKINFIKEYNKHKSNHRFQEWGIPFLSEGLHFHIAKAYEQLGGEFLPYELLLKKMIPLYNFENATNHSENTTIGNFDFWARYNYKDPLAFLDWMISELEKQLKDEAMELKTLTTKEQIQLLKGVRKRLLNIKDDFCLCYRIKQALVKTYGEITLLNKIQDYIPLFRIDYAIEHAKATYGLFWWPRSNKKNRLAFLDWMISELEKQLNN